MRVRHAMTQAESAEILRLVRLGQTARAIAAQVHRSEETVRRVARAAGLTVTALPSGTKRELTQAAADALRERLRLVHATGPQMGVCVACGYWRLLDAEGRLPTHDYGPAECRGSGRYPMRNPVED